jgi:hypothetical protein
VGATSTLNPEKEAEKTREKIESDLKNWQDKFAKAADKGAEDLAERVKEITDNQIKSQVLGVGQALVIQLEEVSASETKKLKETIKEIIRTSPSDKSSETFERSENELSKATRNAGLAVKGKAQALRSWRKNLEEETSSLVNAASKSTLEVIDNIRDLGLQEIGMRWAWMEGVTYKDWSNYHSLKKTFDKWRNQVEEVSRSHEGLKRATEIADEVEGRGMAVAEDAAKELGRLKEVGKWKIHATDASDDFSDRYVPAAAAAAGYDILDKVSSASEQIAGGSQAGLNSVLSDVAKKGNEAVKIASSGIVGTEPGVAERITSKVSKAVSGNSQPTVESVVSAAKRKADQVMARASEAIIGTSAPAYDSIVSAATESLNSAASAISVAISGSSTPLTESASSIMSSIGSGASSAAIVASKKVFAGAMAQKVEKREPILDDVIVDGSEDTYSEKLKSIVDNAGDHFADVTRAVGDALLQRTSTQDSTESLASVADEKYSRALAAASSVLYGTQQGKAESFTSLAGSKYAEAVAA